ncbi:MAG: ferredoxin family protein [Deltaproteobacteria bacterium]|nr:ferredoxin family protein [Deltaproteobacteria bacterium]
MPDDIASRRAKPAPALPNRPSPGLPVVIDADVCTGCNRCVEVCQVDVLIPHPEKGKPPILLHPDECWYEGSCVEHCPTAGAIRLNHPLAQRVRWKRKGTGESFRV